MEEGSDGAAGEGAEEPHESEGALPVANVRGEQLLTSLLSRAAACALTPPEGSDDEAAGEWASMIAEETLRVLRTHWADVGPTLTKIDIDGALDDGGAADRPGQGLDVLRAPFRAITQI